MSFLCCHWSQRRCGQNNFFCFRSLASPSFSHGSLRLLSLCLLSSTGGVAPRSPETLKQPPSSHPPLPCVSDVECCQISQEGLEAVCLLCKLERRGNREREGVRRDGEGKTERRERLQVQRTNDLHRRGAVMGESVEGWRNRTGKTHDVIHCCLFSLVMPESGMTKFICISSQNRWGWKLGYVVTTSSGSYSKLTQLFKGTYLHHPVLSHNLLQTIPQLFSEGVHTRAEQGCIK